MYTAKGQRNEEETEIRQARRTERDQAIVTKRRRQRSSQHAQSSDSKAM